MSSRFGREQNSSLFSAYDAQPSSHSPHRNNAHAYAGPAAGARHSPAFAAYSTTTPDNSTQGPFRAATPNKRGQYSDAVLSELESQNEDQLQGMSAKVRMLKDITSAIGDEIRDSTALAEKMNDSFEGTRLRLKGTMNRMLRMAEKTGVGWKVWLLFFLAIILLFTYVRLF